MKALITNVVSKIHKVKNLPMENKHLCLTFVLILSLYFMTGCASLFNARNRGVKIESSGNETEFCLYNGDGELVHKGKTPCLVSLTPRKGVFQKRVYILATPDGDITKKIEPTLSPWFWGNIVTFFLGCLPDGFNGMMWEMPSHAELDVLSQKHF